jgi:hypothetical protein
MGFLDQSSLAKDHPLTVLLPGFQARCTFHTIGLLQTFLNDEQRGTFTLNDVTLHGLEAGNPAVSMNLPELVVRKDQCHTLAFQSEFSHEDTGLMPHTEQVVVYTSHYAIQGDFHMGADSRVADFIEASKSLFIGATNCYVFPLFQSQAAVIQQAPLIFIARNVVRMHHAL